MTRYRAQPQPAYQASFMGLGWGKNATSWATPPSPLDASRPSKTDGCARFPDEKKLAPGPLHQTLEPLSLFPLRFHRVTPSDQGLWLACV
jgi:hypothetical protein